MKTRKNIKCVFDFRNTIQFKSYGNLMTVTENSVEISNIKQN